MTASVRDGAPTTLWAVMVCRRWSALEILGMALPDDLGPGEPYGWMPIFRARDEAVAYADGNESRVVVCLALRDGDA